MGNGALPVASGREHVRAFQRLGWDVAPRRGKGSHIVMTKPGRAEMLTIPDHDPVKRGTLSALLRAAGVTRDDYLRAFGRR